METNHHQKRKNKALMYAVALSTVLMLAFTITSTIVRAEDGTSEGAASATSTRHKPLIAPRPGMMKEEFKERRANIASTTKERKDELKTRFEERRERIAASAKERAKAHMGRVVKRLEAAVERFLKLAERIASRIEKLSAAGIDMTKAKELLATAEAKIAEADRAVATLKSAIDAALAGENPREVFAEVKEKVRLAIEAVKEAHRALVAAIREVKAKGGVRADSAATSVDTQGEPQTQ